MPKFLTFRQKFALALFYVASFVFGVALDQPLTLLVAAMLAAGLTIGLMQSVEMARDKDDLITVRWGEDYARITLRPAHKRLATVFLLMVIAGSAICYMTRGEDLWLSMIALVLGQSIGQLPGYFIVSRHARREGVRENLWW